MSSKKTYNQKAIAKFYNYHPHWGAVNYDISLAQYGVSGSEILIPVRWFMFYKTMLNSVFRYLKANDTMIDVGCGMGILAQEGHYKVKKYIGVDISIERVKQASEKSKFPNCNFLVADAQQLPFKNNCFDLAVSLEVIEHLPNPMLYLEEVKRVLNNGGLFILSTPCSINYEDMSWQLYKDPHIYEFNLKKLKLLLERNNFFINSIQGIGFKFPKIKIPLWLGSDLLKRVYKNLSLRELKAGYGHPLTFEKDIFNTPLLDKLYFKLKWKRLWLALMGLLNKISNQVKFFASNVIIICQK